MSAPRRITHDDLALFAMQLLSGEEMAEVAAYLEQSNEARQELELIRADLGLYAHTVDLHAPPAQARERLLKQVAKEKKAVPIDVLPSQEETGKVAPVYGSDQTEQEYRGRGGRGLGSGAYLAEDEPVRSLGGRIMPWVGWAVAAGLAVAAGNLYREREALRGSMASQEGQVNRLTADVEAARQVLDTMTDTTAMRVTLTKGQAAPVPQGRTTYVASKGSLIFTASNIEPLPPNKVYELWLIPADGHDPIPAGTFHPDSRGSANVILPSIPKGVEAKAFGVTIEDEGGATTPTLPIIMAGS